LNINTKTEYFNWLVAAAVALLVVGGVAQNWWHLSEVRQQKTWVDANAQTLRATDQWEANSLAPESRLLREPTVNLSPAPPLPEENKIVDFKPLPPTNDPRTQYDLGPTDVAPASAVEQPVIEFAPLPKVDGVVTRDLPPM